MHPHITAISCPDGSCTHLDIREEFLAEVLAGFSARPRSIAPRWLYDRRGSELFEEITRLPEYYLSRAELEILVTRAGEIAAHTDLRRAIVEFGSGSSFKTRLLLSTLAPSAYVAIDVSADFLEESLASLAAAFPTLPIHAIAGDFMRPFTLPATLRDSACLGFFPGSTIGNMTAPVAVDFLRLAARTLGDDAMLLIGIDRIKDPDVLLAAYDDAQGVTAQFNLNLLHRINRELRGTVPVDAFRHCARWNDSEARMELGLEATRAIQFSIDGNSFSMAQGETLHTEISAKYGPRDARVLLRAGGWTPVMEWIDSVDRFALILAENASSVVDLAT